MFAPRPMILFNPRVTWVSEALNTYEEGCLSIPEHYADVTRPAEVEVRLDRPGGPRAGRAVRRAVGDLRAARDRPSGRQAVHRLPDAAEAPADHPQDDQAEAREGAGVILPIRLWPDPVLARSAAPVTAFDAELRRLADDMLETMYAAPGRGLAAPQVGVLQRLFVMDVTWKEGMPQPAGGGQPEAFAIRRPRPRRSPRAACRSPASAPRWCARWR